MYCVNCGVKLSDTEKVCPLCGVQAFHPHVTIEEIDGMYPKGKYPKKEPHTLGVAIFLSVMFLIPFDIVLICDLQLNQKITWSGYVVGALFIAYIALVLPTWFRKPNPVIFVPCTFVMAGVYLLYVNWMTGGEWFISFAFPVIAAICVIATTVTVLFRYLKKGRLYIVGSAFLAFGGVMPLMEYLMSITFDSYQFLGWSFLALTSLWIIGGYLIFLGICRPVREWMERKFFV